MNRWPDPEPPTRESDAVGYAQARQMHVVAWGIIAAMVVLVAAMVRMSVSW